ncbi:hypothetical protein PHYBLDRAFT_186934 [Phycomyces blakesleeanus NRRL 1555(-)]|uniref:RING-type domain-containing protein n=1 Tax=Phycomyces blakesleeanus (strain ATCC 8743b / DSM 1359 / FGSC 10004 / NBRC 33097 / NRRL 1555) TaxID=763407 RepID=A0A167MSK9_PHYB8|nr:hypothetical protein PHYBLDRAFT_186934 [Phycomyces blakesleeanus NRRL 1555(-)]OAD73804.1 hypothetical protein PHYBLDRAFT_186934 [Phycomyces blakesleeanus NRRL 1555(-)]|eukprot:XP_018291844.1 hypothetical protein PHYBLDRAFT_186934 [Phycomyces blakesleeanus NRRL 1555(-)]
MSDVNNNSMGPVLPADDEARAVFHEIKEVVVDKLHELNHEDNVHGLHEMDQLKRISSFKLVEYAVEEVAYGFNYFGKIDLGDEKFIHVRAHKYHDGRVEFYSILTTPETAIWTREEPLVLSHRYQPSTSTHSSGSSASSTRPALPQILTHSPSNAVHLSRSTARTSRRVRSHWVTHFTHSWRRSSRTSKLYLASSLTLVALQVIACAGVLAFSWNMYCDRPVRIFLTVHLLRLSLSSPITIYLHFDPRQTPQCPSQMERGEAYPMAEQGSSTGQVPNVQIPPEILPENGLGSWVDRIKGSLDFFAVLWFVVGNYMIFSSTTCVETATPLYYLALAVIIYGYIILAVPIILCTSVIFCLPCVLGFCINTIPVGMRLLHVSDGVKMGGSSVEEISTIPIYRFKSSKKPTVVRPPKLPGLLPVQTMTIDPVLGERNSIQVKSPPGWLDKLWLYIGLVEEPLSKDSPEQVYDVLEIPDEKDQVCAICLSMYEDGDILCKLWCTHHFHKACVYEWLALNYRCPMCKQDSRGKKSSTVSE